MCKRVKKGPKSIAAVNLNFNYKIPQMNESNKIYVTKKTFLDKTHFPREMGRPKNSKKQ